MRGRGEVGNTRTEQKKREMAKMERGGEKMDREAVERASWREIERDVQGYGMFGGSSMFLEAQCFRGEGR